MKIKRIVLLLVVLCLSLGNITFASDYATRGEVADFLLQAADFYNPGVLKEDIIKGYEDGLLHEERSVTRAEALVMLKRAFGDLPELTGHNKRVAYTAEHFTDIPDWAKKELSDVFDSGIVAGTAPGIFSPNQNVTMEQMELFANRVYSIYGTSPADDFYAYANKEFLETIEIPEGEYIHGTMYELQTEASTRVDSIIRQVAGRTHKKGTPEQKMADLYKCIMDKKGIDKVSIAPIKNYIDEIEGVKTVSELSELQLKLTEELCVSPFMEFSLVVDFEDSSKYMLMFSTLTPYLNKEMYVDGSPVKNEYISYLETLLTISGEDEEIAAKNARDYFEFEKRLSEHMLDTQDLNNVGKVHNIYSYSKIQAMFPDCDFQELLKASYLKKENKAMIVDVKLTKYFSEVYNQSNIDVLKTAAKISVMSVWGETLDTRIEKALEKLKNAIFGTEGIYTREQKASLVLQNVMPDYIGKFYVEEYFDEESKNDVIQMVEDIREIFKIRIESLDWMSEKTKEKAIRKLDNMKIKIGYPDSFNSFIDNVEIVSLKNGGTYFSNMLAITKAYKNNYASLQYLPVDHSGWSITPYTANAGYDLNGNSITFPAAILQAPLYDKNASDEENYGGIGFIIAHEMTHAFDENGALFDENGSLNNWWADSDYEAFTQLCDEVITFYDGYETVPGITTNGSLTLSENVADLGATACLVQLAREKDISDYEKLFSAMANTFAMTYTREYAEFAENNDPHSDGKARINRVVVQFEEFYRAFNVKEGDGMYVPPEKRIRIW